MTALEPTEVGTITELGTTTEVETIEVGAAELGMTELAAGALVGVTTTKVVGSVAETKCSRNQYWFSSLEYVKEA
jgi:hypothetical protein